MLDRSLEDRPNWNFSFSEYAAWAWRVLVLRCFRCRRRVVSCFKIRLVSFFFLSSVLFRTDGKKKRKAIKPHGLCALPIDERGSLFRFRSCLGWFCLGFGFCLLGVRVSAKSLSILLGVTKYTPSQELVARHGLVRQGHFCLTVTLPM